MKYFYALFTYGLSFFISINWGEIHGEEFITYYQDLSFFPIELEPDKCYQLYDQNEKVTPISCKRKINTSKQSCIVWLNDEKTCIGLKTPSNESIVLLCNEKLKYVEYLYTEDICFKVFKTEKEQEIICLEIFENYSIGLTTPDKYTILLDSYYCNTYTSTDTRDSYNEFTNNFSFKPDVRSCFKIYRSDQELTPYTCFSDDVYDSCIEQLPHHNNCYGIMTQKNETIILHCPDNVTSNNTNCFKIYDGDDNVHISCIEKVEERCVGFITPNNLTVLVECYFCSEPHVKELFYDSVEQKKYRQFVEMYIKDEYLGKNSYLNNTKFLVFNQKRLVRPRLCNQNGVYGYWIPNTSCYGITLESNETVLFECIETKKNYKQLGCYKIIDSQQKEYTRCAEILEERCVGIKTAGNLFIALACYEKPNYCANNVDLWKNFYAKHSIDYVTLEPHLHDCYEIYNENEIIGTNICTKSARPENYSCIDWIPGRKDYCIGLKTPANETIEIHCSKTKEDFPLDIKIYCFNIYKFDENVTRRCIKKFDDYTLGITTPSNYSIITNSYFCPTYKNPQYIENSHSFVRNFIFNPDIRSCYKIYREDQDVSPNNCLDKEIHESCVHYLPETNCMGITTQNNETIVLTCSKNEDRTQVDACFKIYTNDNKIHVSCQEKLEESCVGIITPSKLKILFECKICSSPEGEYLPHYTSQERKQYRSYVEQAFQIYMKGYSFPEGKSFPISKPNQRIHTLDCKEEISHYYVHKLYDHDNCLGVTMENYETVVLECPGKQPEKPGCFEVFSSANGLYSNSPLQKVQTVCLRILNERCVGIITPGKWTIPFNCTLHPFPACPYAAISVPPNGPPRRM